MIYDIFFIILLIGAVWCAWEISVADMRRRIIPDAFLWPLMLIGLIVTTWTPFWPTDARMAVVGAAFGYALAAMVGFLFDWRIRRTSPDAMAPIGMGDIKLIAVGGLWLGVTGLSVALIISCLGGAIWGRLHHQRYIPFGPFFIAGGILTLIGQFFLI